MLLIVCGKPPRWHSRCNTDLPFICIVYHLGEGARGGFSSLSLKRHGSFKYHCRHQAPNTRPAPFTQYLVPPFASTSKWRWWKKEGFGNVCSNAAGLGSDTQVFLLYGHGVSK